MIFLGAFTLGDLLKNKIVDAYNFEVEKSLYSQITESPLNNVTEDIINVKREYRVFYGQNTASDPGKANSQSLTSLYKNNAIVRIYTDTNKDASDRTHSSIAKTLKENLTDLGESVFTSLMSTGQFAESILKRAINNVVNEYTNINSDGETITTKYSYENYNTSKEVSERMREGGDLEDEKIVRALADSDDEKTERIIYLLNIRHF